MSFEQEKQTYSWWHIRTTLLKNIKDLFKRHAYFSVSIWYTTTLFFFLFWRIPVWNAGKKSARYKILLSSVMTLRVHYYYISSSALAKSKQFPPAPMNQTKKRLILSHCLSIVVSFTSLNHTQDLGLNLPDEQHFQGKELGFKMICPSADSTGKRWHLESMKLHSPSCAKEWNLFFWHKGTYIPSIINAKENQYLKIWEFYSRAKEYSDQSW